MAARSISLLELRRHLRKLDALVHDAIMSPTAPAEISYADIRKHAAAISAMVAEDGEQSPHAATATKPPAAADKDKATSKERADYQRAAADKAPGFDLMGIYHVRKG